MSDDGDDVNFMDEINAYKRGGRDVVGTGTVVQGELGKIMKKYRDQTGIDDFCNNVNRIARDFDMDDSEIQYMTETARNVTSKIEFKNPIAYVLGYIASSGGKEITVGNVKKAFKKLKSDMAVTQPDVIRYARYWMLNV